MPAASHTAFAIYGQIFRVHFVIRSTATGNPLTGGLTVLAATISKDEGNLVATTNAPVEIQTSGQGYLELTAAEMTASGILVDISASNANAVVDVKSIHPMRMDSDIALRWDKQAVLLFEQMCMQGAAYALQKVTMGDSTGAIALYKRDGVTLWLSGTASDDGTSTTKPALL